MFFQAEDGIRDLVRSRGLVDVYKRQLLVTLIFWSVTKLQDTGFRFKGRELILANVFIALALGTYYGSVFFIAALYGYLLLKKEFKLFAYLLPGTLVAGFFLYPLFLTQLKNSGEVLQAIPNWSTTVSYTHLRAHETVLDLVCRLLLEKKKIYSY